MVRHALATGLASALLAACTVGPDYVRPAAPAVDAFVQGTPAQADAPPQDLRFWQAFGDARLSALVEQALRNNHDLQAALANWEQAQASLRGARWDQAPSVSTDATAGRQRLSADQLPGVDRNGRDEHVYSGSAGLSWELDLFGRLRRGTEAARADSQAAAADLAAAQVAIVSQIASSWFALQGLQARLEIARANASAQQRTLEVLQQRLDAGMADTFDVDRARAQLESTRAQLPALEAQETQAANRIAVLAGATPESMATTLLATPPAMAATLPAPPPPGTPAELLRRRPDVTAAERRLAASTARIGVATADLFPRITLGALFGTQALGASALFARDSETRLLSADVGGGFLDIGRVRSRIAAANAGSRAALAQYDQTVLLALEGTENALVTQDRSRVEATHLQQAAQASARAADTARLQFDHGAIDTLALLEAERTRLSAQDAAVQASTRSAQALVDLYAALAGGWPDAPPAVADAQAARR